MQINARPQTVAVNFAECGKVAIMQRSGYVAIVDDDASMREALARMLRIHEINSRSYPSARVFLEGLTSGMPDCLIVDVNMPEMTGIELQRELLNRGIRIPTIVITATDGKGIAASAASLGAVAFLPQAGAARRADGSDQFSEETTVYAHAGRFRSFWRRNRLA